MDTFSPEEMEEIPCPVCGEANSSASLEATDLLGGVVGKFWVRTCSKCGAGYLSPRPKASVIGRAYAGRGDMNTGHLGDNLERFLQAQAGRVALLQEAAKPGPVLDIGSGDGLFMLAAKRAGYDPKGIEVSEPCRVSQFAMGLTSLSPPDPGLPLPFPTASFSAVTFWASLEHVHDPAWWLGEAHRVLAPGGGLIVNVPNFGSLERRLFGAKWFALQPPVHLVHFTPSSLSGLTRRRGFVEERVWCASTETNVRMSLRLRRGSAAESEKPEGLLSKGLRKVLLRPGLRMLDSLNQGGTMLLIAKKR